MGKWWGWYVWITLDSLGSEIELFPHSLPPSWPHPHTPPSSRHPLSEPPSHTLNKMIKEYVGELDRLHWPQMRRKNTAVWWGGNMPSGHVPDNPGTEYLPPTSYVTLGKPLNFSTLRFPKYKLETTYLQNYEFSLRRTKQSLSHGNGHIPQAQWVRVITAALTSFFCGRNVTQWVVTRSHSEVTVTLGEL